MILSIFLAVSCDTSIDAPSGAEGKNDAEAVAAAKESLEISFADDDEADYVTRDMTLPKSAAGGVSVEWASDNAAAASDSGTVTRPAAGTPDAAVTMTATLSKGSAKDAKEFRITVVAKSLSFAVTDDWTSFGSVSEPTVYGVCADGDGIYLGTMSNGLLYSDDDGATWGQLTSSDGLLSNQVYTVRKSGDLVFIGNFGGLQAWDRSVAATVSLATCVEGTVTDFVLSGGKFYAAVGSTLYYGIAGDPAGAASIETALASVASLSVDGGYLYVYGTTNTASGSAELLKIALSDLTSPPTRIDVISGFTTSANSVYADGTTIYAGADWALYRSVDGGASFACVSDLGGGTIHGIEKHGTCVFVAKYGSPLWYTANRGERWQSVPIPGYDDFFGIAANDIAISDGSFLIAHEKGLVRGTVR